MYTNIHESALLLVCWQGKHLIRLLVMLFRANCWFIERVQTLKPDKIYEAIKRQLKWTNRLEFDVAVFVVIVFILGVSIAVAAAVKFS